MRNPSAAQKQFPNLLLGFALAEATGLFGLVVALLFYLHFRIKYEKSTFNNFIIFLSETFLFAAEAGMPQLDQKYWFSQSFWLILIFLILYFLLSKIFIPKIKDNLDDRENKIKENLE